jgi:hypothetical protein
LGAGRSVAGPQSRELPFKPCCRFLRRRGLGSRLEQLHHQAVCTLALTLEICTVTSRCCFKPCDLRLQCLDLCCEQSNVAWLASA